MHFILKLQPELIHTEARLASPPHGDLVHYHLHVDRSDSTKTGKYTATIKDLLDASGSFKSVNRKGDGTTTITLPGLAGRQVKLDTTFNLASPAYDWKSELYYDLAADQSKKISVETKNKITDSALDSATTVTVLKDTYAVTVGASLAGTAPFGQQNVAVQVQLPTQRTLGVELKRDAKRDGDKVQGTITGRLTDANGATGKQRSVAIAAKLDEADTVTRFFRVHHELVYTGFDGQTAKVTADTRHQKAGNYKTAGTTVELSGSLLAYPVKVEVVADEYCPWHAKFHADAAYGDKATAALKGEWVWMEVWRQQMRLVANATDLGTDVNILAIGTSSQDLQHCQAYIW